MTTRQQKESVADALGPEAAQSRANAARLVLVLVVLLSAFVVPYIGYRFGWGWGVVTWAAAAIVLLVALRINPRGYTRGGGAERFVNWLSIASPRVNQFLGRIKATERTNAENAARYSNMTALLASYGLPGDGASVPTLVAPLYTADENAASDSLVHISRGASCAVATAAPEFAGRKSQLVTCLALLYLDQYEHADQKDINEVKQRWMKTHSDVIGLLAELMVRHAVFQFSAHDATQIEAALRNPRHQQLPTLAAVVAQLKQSPTQIVSNMDVVARRFGFGVVDREDWDGIAVQLAGVSDAEIPRAVAGRFAEKLATSGRSRVATHLELLYRDCFKRPSEGLWARYKLSPPLRADLAARLAEFGPLAPKVDRGGRAMVVTTGRLRRSIHEILDSLATFELGLLQATLARVEAFWTLTTAYAGDLADRELPRSGAFEGSMASRRFLKYLVDHGALPSSDADSGSLDDPSLVLPLLVEVAEESIRAYVCGAGEEGGQVAHREDANALATVSVGRYLMGDGGRPELAAALARENHRNDAVVAALLAVLWQRRARIDAKSDGKVALHELVCGQREWYKDAEADFHEGLCADVKEAIAAHLLRGEWPTQLPLDWMLQRFAEQIVTESRSHDPESAKKIESIKDEVERLTASSSEVPQELVDLIKRIEGYDPDAADAERNRKLDDMIRSLGQVRERPLEELTVAVNDLQRIDAEMQEKISSLETTDRAVGQTVDGLKTIDERVVLSIGHLTETDNELKAVVERLVNAVPAASRTYLITWPARSGRIAELMKHLANPDATSDPQLDGKYKWLTHDRTPYARLGRLPTGMSFDEFCDHLQHDLAVVNHVQQSSKNPHVYVQQIGDRIDVK